MIKVNVICVFIFWFILQINCENWSINDLIPKGYDPKKLPLPNGNSAFLIKFDFAL